MITLGHYLALSAVLFAIGLFGVITRRNLIATLMSIELLLNAAAIAFAATAAFKDPVFFSGQLFALFVMVVAAAELSIGFAILLNVFVHTGTSDTDAVEEMRG